MANSYPRKQTFLISLAAIVVVGGATVYTYGWPNFGHVSYVNKSQNANLPIYNTGNAIAAATKDADWQKQFIDAKASDTAFKATAKASVAPTKQEPLTPTDILGRNFFTKYAQLHQAGLTTDEKTVNQAANDIIAQSVANISTPKAHTAADIKIIPAGSDMSATKTYAEALMNILKTTMPAKNEAEIAMEAFDKDNLAMLKNIDPIISGYNAAIAKLIATPVIQPLAQYHLDLINALSLQTFNAASLRKADTDPLSALAAVSLEIKSLQAIANAVAAMQTYFASAGIVFNLPVSGSVLQSR